jgi:hypothetical protein
MRCTKVPTLTSFTNLDFFRSEGAMIVWLIEFAISVAVGVSVVYFFFLTSAPPVAGALPISCSTSKAGLNDSESVSWLSCIQHWCAAAALGGGSVDSAMWSSRLAHHMEHSLRHLHTGATSPSIHLEAFAFAEGCDSVRGADKERRHKVSPLPVISSVRCRTSHGPGQAVTRELICTLGFADASFHVRLNCEAPLLGGLPPDMRIPAHLLSLKGVIDVREIAFEADICIRLCGQRAEIFFPAPPHIDSKILAFPSGSRRSSHSQLPMEVKAGEMVKNAIRMSLETLVFPRVLVLTVHGAAPFLRWSCEQLDSASQ